MFATFAAGFIVRPFGALVFGRLGDILIGLEYTFLFLNAHDHCAVLHLQLVLCQVIKLSVLPRRALLNYSF